jgi:hypothetical protein
MNNLNNEKQINSDFIVTNPKDNVTERLIKAGYEPKAFNFEENEMNNLTNEKSGMALAAESEIANAINSQNEGVTVIDPEKNIIVLNRNKSYHNGFFLGTSGEGRTFHVKQELYEEMMKKENLQKGNKNE